MSMRIRAARNIPLSRPFRVFCVASALGATGLAHAQLNQDAISSAAPELPAARGDGEPAAAVAQKRFFSITPSLSLDWMWTDNIRLQTGDSKESDFVMTTRPGLRFLADGDRLKASVDYSLSRLSHARDRSLDRNQNTLDATGSYELVENFAFVDFSGNISQQTVSAFGQRSDNDAAFNANRTEVATYRLSPYVRGQLGDFASYQARYSRLSTRTKSQLALDYDSNDMSLVLNGNSQQRVFSWSVDLSHQELDYSNGLSFESDRARMFLTHPITPQLAVSVIPGWESNNYATAEKDSRATIGGRVNWAASDRTSLSALLEKRFFGRAYSVDFEHRTPRTAWRYSNSRDASVTPNQLGTTSLGPLYDLLFFQFASVEPDPIRRAQLVQSFLLANGLNGNTNVNLGFLTSAVSLARRQDLSFTLLGRRDTLTFLLSQSENSRLLQNSGDLADSNFVRQHGFTITYSHRLTPESTLTVLGTQSRASGQLALQSSTLRALNVSLSTRLGKHTTATMALRRAQSNNTLSSYSETAVRGGISLQF
ncbi:TIGR03016 family PEP-CTERM system-associated outer membrane protein [Pseudorhodoferax sp. Leaf267]|uniref:TIGR03016 family PEP-CTERM system-associated outer membrane protein n=1 Tax=Pseudorhodoferax sp. Leaf267 TaxID=1736316 RepID=UPI00138F8AFA|nr:TIGR03016 family PEP-CTERM system-associated outer membrane protein [Pseudorhodoferax sp. Leaf267]